jgi:hypothetical protein
MSKTTRKHQSKKLQFLFSTSLSFLFQYKLHLLALIVVLAWCLPYFTTGNRIELGDFSFFAQSYEAMRISILEYHQFPWWNPWMSGGFPLYANPQTGVISIQTILVLIFGSVAGLKLSLVLYTIAGYFSMFILLHRYFKIRPPVAIPLSLAWILSSFFVAHLPSHYTFVWYLLIPLFIYLSLVAKTWRGGIVLGGAFAIMALSAVHNPLFQIGLVSGIILIIRLVITITRKHEMKNLLLTYLTAVITFSVLAAHRLYFAYQTVKSLNRPAPPDGPINLADAPYAVFMPFHRHDYLAGKIIYPESPFSWGEVTSSGGIVLSTLFFIAIGITIWFWSKKRFRSIHKQLLILISVLILLVGFFMLLGTGNFNSLSPYAFLKKLPVFMDMRVSTRWFLWVTFLVLIIVGIITDHLVTNKKAKMVSILLLALVVVELFTTNLGYQSEVLTLKPITAPAKASTYPFTQIDQFGSMHVFSDGRNIPDDHMGPQFYREFEATTYNIGIIRANEPLVNNRWLGLRCVEDSGCQMILSNNAKITSWSPNKITLERTGPGIIILNVNSSRYIRVDGKRIGYSKVADTSQNVDISVPDSQKNITITYDPKYR